MKNTTVLASLIVLSAFSALAALVLE